LTDVKKIFILVGQPTSPPDLSEHVVNIDQYLHNHLLFRSLTPEQLKRACFDARMVRINRGDQLFGQGEQATAFFLLVEGQMKLARLSPGGDEKIIEIINAGGTFAEALMFLRARHYPVSAQAMKDSTLIRINSEHYYSVLSESNESCLAMLGDLSSRIHGLINEIDKLTLHNAACRIAGYLMSRVPENGLVFELDIPKLALASRLAIKPETLSRIIKQLSQERLIKVDKSQIEILDPSELQVFAESCTQLEADFRDSFNLG
jgi:CRP-like cAMP-binding protein